ncbi:MAG: glycosyltransferase family 87 protein [Candidatus Limnocylindrales bacterium]
MNSAARRLAGIAALVLAAAYAAATLATAPGDAAFGYDLDAYIGAAHRLTAGEPLYPASGPDGLTPVGQGAFFYPPPVAVAFIPLAQLPDPAARIVWFVLLIVLAALVGAWLVRGLGAEARLWALAGYLAYLPLLSELRYGNLNLVTLALCLAAWHQRARAPVAGALLAAALGIKLLPLALVVFLLGARRWRIVAWAAGTGFVVIAASWPWLGRAWGDYLGVIGAIGVGTPAAGSNIVPEALAASPLRYLLPLIGIGIAAITGLVARRSARREGSAFTTALAAAPLLATTVWYPYLVLALPAIVGWYDARSPGATTPDGVSTGGRVAAWLAIAAQPLRSVVVWPLPLSGLVVAVVTAMRDLSRHDPVP